MYDFNSYLVTFHPKLVDEVNPAQCEKLDSDGRVCLQVAQRAESSSATSFAATSMMAILTAGFLL